jgi:hypothetical protein
MGHWGYKATESDSALDYLAKVTEHLEKMWDEAEDYGEKMAIVYILTEAPVVDITDYKGLKDKCAKYLREYKELLQGERNAYSESQKEIDYSSDSVSFSPRDVPSLNQNLLLSLCRMEIVLDKEASKHR